MSLLRVRLDDALFAAAKMSGNSILLKDVNHVSFIAMRLGGRVDSDWAERRLKPSQRSTSARRFIFFNG